jgi:hypothetical protein
MDDRDRHLLRLRRDDEGTVLADLHDSPECGSGLVHTTEWEPVDDRHWRVALRCPECEWHSVGLYEQAVLDRFDRVLDAGAASLQADLRKLERVNMAEELRRFTALLSGNLVLPEDF